MHMGCSVCLNLVLKVSLGSRLILSRHIINVVPVIHRLLATQNCRIRVSRFLNPVYVKLFGEHSAICI